MRVIDLPAMHVACAEFLFGAGQDEIDSAIRERFRLVQAWVKEQGCDPLSQLTIGVLTLSDGRPVSYGCCVQVPATVQHGSGEVSIKDLPGGRYAVVTVEKDPAVIGESIRRFHQEYAPQHHLQVDGGRPTYEIYFERTMEYCAPVL